MKIVNKKFNIWWSFLLIFWLFVVIVLPIKARADFQDRCWLKNSCESANGIWGKSSEYKNKFGNRYPNLDSLSTNCDNIGSNETALCFLSDPAIALQVGIPGISEKFCNNYILGEEPKTCTTDKDCSGGGKCRPGIRNGFSGYLKGFFNFFIPAIAVMSVVMIMWGGFKRIAAAGSSETIKGANDTILGAVSGLILALISYSLLNLINPALVMNSLPPIEKVKPDFFGFCPKYIENKSLYEDGYQMFSCKGTSQDAQAGKSCVDKSGCGGEKDQCNENQIKNGDPGETCGKKILLNGKECIGNECTRDGYGCFEYDKNGKNRYACSQRTFTGRVAGVGLDNIDLMYVCNYHTENRAIDCLVNKPNQSVEGMISMDKATYYSIGHCWTGKNSNGYTALSSSACQGGGQGLKGVALVVEVVADGANDWYAIDAQTCGIDTNRIIDGDGDDDPKADIVDKIDWSLVSKEKLFQIFDSNGKLVPINCDLNITYKNFPDR